MTKGDQVGLPRTFEGSSNARRVGFLALLALLALLAAGCGGSDNGGSPTEAAAAPSGDPIKVMSEAPVDSPAFSYPNIPGAAKVYAQWINAKGGIAGRPLQVISCDDRADAAEAANCARKAAEEGVV